MLHDYCIRRLVKNGKKIDETNVDKFCNAKRKPARCNGFGWKSRDDFVVKGLEKLKMPIEGHL